MHADSFLIQALVYLAAGVISVPIAKRLGLGSVLGYLIAGALVGPFVLDLVGEPGDVMRFVMRGGARLGLIGLVLGLGAAVFVARLMKSIPHYLWRSGGTIVRAYTMYRPMRVFITLGAILIVLGLIPGFRFLYLYAFVAKTGHIQSLILSAILIIIGVQTLLIGLLADLISSNRRIVEEALYRLRKLEANEDRRGHPGE